LSVVDREQHGRTSRDDLEDPEKPEADGPPVGSTRRPPAEESDRKCLLLRWGELAKDVILDRTEKVSQSGEREARLSFGRPGRKDGESSVGGRSDGMCA
jgi:hypothetical protein